MVNIIINPPKAKQNGLQEVLSNCKFPEVMDCDSRDQSIQLFPPKCFSQIQTSCNFEAYLYSCRHHLDQVYFRCCPLPGRFCITISYGCIVIPLCVIVSFVSYTRIFWALIRRSNEVQDLVQHRNSQTNPLNIVRYRKAVNGSLSVQLVLLVCYSPFAVVEISVVTNKAPFPSYLLAWVTTGTLVFFNSSLNPILYCWKINEVRQAVKQIIRQAFYCPWEQIHLYRGSQ